MKITKISSDKNDRIKWLKKLNQKAKFRNQEGLYIVEGYKQVEELSEARIHTLVVSAKRDAERYREMIAGEIILVSEQLFSKISTDVSPQGILAVVYSTVQSLKEADIHPKGIYLALDGIQDPGNIGTMIRVCDAVGGSGIIVNKETVDIYNPKVVKSTMGSLEHIPVYYVDKLNEGIRYIKDKGIRVYGAYLDDSKYHYQYNYEEGICFVIGNEGSGISDPVLAEVDYRVKIPMPGESESLNAAVAASILLYEALRQKMES